MLDQAREAIDGTGATTLQTELRVVAPQEVRAAWTQVRGGIEKVIEKCEDRFLPEDVYVALQQGTSVLMVGYVASYYVGFVVVTPTIGWDGPELHLWLAYNRGKRDVCETFMPQIVAHAKRHNCVSLTGMSDRKGWEKRATQLGWRATMTKYEMEI
jgi:hypothetical protein